MTLKAFRFEEAVQVGDETLRLVLDFGALDAIEGLTGRPFPETLDEIAAETAGSATQARVVWGLLRRHHGETTIDQATTLVFGAVSAAIGIAIAKLIDAAFATDKPTDGKPRPRKPRGASASS